MFKRVALLIAVVCLAVGVGVSLAACNSKQDKGQITQTYVVKFYNYDGTLLKVQDVEKGKDATAPNIPERDGYEFNGWNGVFLNIQADTNLIAQWHTLVHELPSTEAFFTGFTNYRKKVPNRAFNTLM